MRFLSPAGGVASEELNKHASNSGIYLCFFGVMGFELKA
jgi:hypothetical protein